MKLTLFEINKYLYRQILIMIKIKIKHKNFKKN